MSKKNVKVVDRVLAVFLTVLMLFSMMPVSIFANAAAETDYTITVKDEEANSISGATVAYAINVDGEKAEDGNATTDENGVAVIDLAEYADEKAEDKAVTIDCTVSKDGYVAKETEITVEALNGNTVVTLEEIKIETVNVSVSKTGNGTVKINGEESVAAVEKGSDVKIKIEPEDGAYINSLSVNGEEKTVAEYGGYTETITANEDISVVVVFSTKYTVSVKGEVENGKIKLDEKDVKSLTVDKDEKVKITVTPDKGYQIASVIFNDAEQLEANAVTFEEEVSAATTVEVTFVKVYEVTVIYNSNGTVKTDTDPDNEGGEVSVVSGEATIFEIGKKFQIIADPNENYRVSKVIINDDIQTVDVDGKAIGENEATYKSQNLDVNDNYSITVTFAPNVYDITINDIKNGTVTVPSNAEHGSDVTVEFKPEAGYILSEILVNGVNKNADVVKDGDKNTILALKATEDLTITVTYKKLESADLDDVEITKPVNEKGNCLVYSNKTGVEFKTSKQGIRIFDSNGNRIDGNAPVAFDKNACTISAKSKLAEDKIDEKIDISLIQLYYRAEGDLFKDWHDVAGSDKLSIVFDNSTPDGIITSEDKYYSEDFSVSFKAGSDADYAGIDTIEYQTYYLDENGNEVLIQGKGTNDEDKGILYEHNDVSAVYEKNVSADIIAANHNYAYGEVFIRFIVTDIAGNTGTCLPRKDHNPDCKYCYALKVYTGAPEITVSYSNGVKNDGKIRVGDELPSAAKEGHYKSIDLTVKIKERCDVFDSLKATGMIAASYSKKVLDEESEDYGKEVTTNCRFGEWDPQRESGDEGDIVVDENGYCTYVLTKTFSADGRYTVDIGKYSNIAEVSKLVGKRENFTIDNTYPQAKIIVDNDNSWSEFLETISFGIFKNEEVKVTVEADDEVSGLYDVEYYKDNGTSIIKRDDLETIYTGENVRFGTGDSYRTIGTEGNERAVVYARIVDEAGLVTYVGTNGVIYDTTDSVVAEFEMPKAPGSSGIYNSSIEIGVNVSEVPLKVLNEEGETEEIFSGIKEVKYQIVDENSFDGSTYKIQTDPKVVYKYEKVVDENNKEKYVASQWIWKDGYYSDDDDDKYGEFDVIAELDPPTYEKLSQIAEWNGKIRVDANKFKSDNIKLIVTVTDNAGNVTIKESKEPFSINIDSPVVDINIDGKPVYPVDGIGRGYYNAPRKATITITERFSAFNKDNATNAIRITAKDVNGKDVEGAFNIGEWNSKALEGSDKTEFKAVVTFDKDANYTFNFDGYVNNAMNDFEPSEETYSTVGYTVNAFTVDTTDPTGTVTVLENTWNKLLSTLTFGLFSQKEVEVTATYEDETSLLNKVEYYKTTNPIALTFEQLDDLYANAKFESYKKFTNPEAENIKVSPDEQFVIYYRIEDKAGNYTYINSDGCIVDDTHSDIVITPAEPLFAVEGVGNYNGDVKVDISVAESENEENYAGIKSIEYWVIKDGQTETQRKTLYSFDRDTAEDNLNINSGSIVETDWATGEKVVRELSGPTQDVLKKTWNGSVVVDSELNNSCNIVIYVKTVDNAGNEDTKSVPLDIDITAPTIDVTYDNNKDNNGNGYFDADRTATVVITERTAHFDSKKATEGIVITAVNAKDAAVEDAYVISDWKTVEGETPDEAKHTATIHFAKDANYTFEISYTDNSENKNTEVNTGDSVAPYKFTVDTVKPFGTITAKSKEGRETEWDKLITDLTFGFWSREEISITSTSDDETSPIASVEYYIEEAKEEKDASDAVTVETLDAVKEWKILDKLSIDDNKRFTVYLKITDNAGNYSYISTDGLIVDEEAPIEEVIAPEVTVMPEQPINGFYNGDVKVAIKVVDPLVKGSYSGLKTVSYKVYDKAISETEPTQSGTLYTFETENPKQDQLLKEWTGQITVDSSKNNSNDVVIEIFAEDNSLNTSRDDVSIKIDVTAPEINVSYNNNKVDSNSFFKADRTATIVVTERNFNPDDVVINITNTDGAVPSITNWKKTDGKGNLDDTKWTTTVTYNKDGDYTFDIEYTDLADNKCSGADYGKSAAAKKFTIDKTDPVVSVSYDNNSAKNGKYFAAGRTATIVIDEHNFDINRVNFVRTSRLDGSNITAPNVSWNHTGDVHTATITYTADGDYTFDVEVDDKAGNNNKSVNYGNSVAGEEFTVDKTIAKPTINGVVNGKAYKNEVVPSISFSDINYDTYEVKLLRTRMGEKNVDVTSQLMKGVSQNATGGSGTYDTFDKIADNDGIYTLNVKVIDKAGNEDSDSVTFTVNRFGSVYEYGDYLIDRIEKRYITSIDEDLIITEYNADRLVGGSLNIEVTCDGKPLGDVQYDVSPVMNETVAVGSSGWFQYEYTISKANFESDGVYKIFVSSEDATGNKPENSNYEDKAITFMVDSTAPEITSITGLEEAIVNATEQEVKYTIFDTIGLKSIKVLVDGKQVSDTITDFSADLNNYSGSFKLSEKSPAQNVQIIVEDLAGNITDTESETFTSEYVFNSKVTVSTNFFVRWYANKGLFWGSIAGFLAIVAAIIFFVVKRRKKG